MAYEAADCGLLSPDLAAGIRRVKGVKKIGLGLGNWASIGILGRLNSVVKREDETWAMAQVLGLETLETPDTSMTYPSIDAISILHPTPSNFALGAARYLVSSKDSAFNRAYEADGLLRALGEPLLGTPRFYQEKKQGQ